MTLISRQTSIKLTSLKRGFTLIELLVVISIIGILVAVGATSYQRAVRVSRDSKRKTDLAQIQQALETYRSQNGTYPSAATWQSDLENGYINDIPTPPQSDVYTYTNPTSTTYSLCASLETIETPATCNYAVTNP
jgi:general secretion pathway protein G